MEKNSRLFGFVLGAIVPVLSYVVLDFVFEMLSQQGLLGSSSGEGISRRMRTIALMSICCNLLIFNWAKRNYYDDTMRGVIFPTMIYVGYWIYTFYNVLF
jgi:hypothetical protein